MVLVVHRAGASARQALAIALTCVPSAALAHDFWVEARPFHSSEPGPVEVRLRVGHEDDIRNVERRPDRILRFQRISPSETAEIGGKAGQEPAGRFTSSEPGTHVLVYRSNHAYLELKAEAFETYLKHEGLEAIIDQRAAREQSDRKGRESYARSCKALVVVGEPSKHWRRRVGLPLEIVPRANPFRAEPRQAFVVLFRGRPLEGARLDLFDLDDLTRSSHGTTDPRGRVTLDEVGDGPWLVATTHMVRSGPKTRGDWESFWSTLTWAPLPKSEASD